MELASDPHVSDMPEHCEICRIRGYERKATDIVTVPSGPRSHMATLPQAKDKSKSRRVRFDNAYYVCSECAADMRRYQISQSEARHRAACEKAEPSTGKLF